jgi:hypothetical protein
VFKTRDRLVYDRRFSRWSLDPGFSQVDVTLDSAQGLIADYFVIAQADYGLAFCFQRLAG